MKTIGAKELRLHLDQVLQSIDIFADGSSHRALWKNTRSLTHTSPILIRLYCLGLEAADFEWAFTNLRNDDFEDALQIGIAIGNGCTDSLTFDRGLHKAYVDLPSINMKLLG
jgi:hypothetical protein